MACTIKIHLKSKIDYTNTYNDEILSYSLNNYILEETKSINIKNNIKFVITSDFVMSDKEKNNLVDMIRNNFGTDVGEIINLSEKEKLANLSIFLIGILFLMLYSLFKINFLSDFILILGWVFIGETICNVLYHGIENSLKVKKRKQIIRAKIVFE